MVRARFIEVGAMRDGGPSYELIDSNLLAGNPVIVLFALRHGGYHFVVIVGKEGWDHLIRDPAASPFRPAYPLRCRTDQIAGLCFFQKGETPFPM